MLREADRRTFLAPPAGSASTISVSDTRSRRGLPGGGTGRRLDSPRRRGCEDRILASDSWQTEQEKSIFANRAVALSWVRKKDDLTPNSYLITTTKGGCLQ